MVHTNGLSPVCSLSWFLKETTLYNFFSQYLHCNVIPDVCLLSCTRSDAEVLKRSPQRVHKNGISPLCFLWCSISLLEVEKRLSHTLQWNRFCSWMDLECILRPCLEVKHLWQSIHWNDIPPVCFIVWRFRSLATWKRLSQCSHLKASRLWMFSCCFRRPSVVKPFWQCVQWNISSWVWSFSCIWKWYEREKLFPQYVHRNGLSSECVILWCSKSSLLEKVLSSGLHLTASFPVCTITSCSFRCLWVAYNFGQWTFSPVWSVSHLFKSHPVSQKEAGGSP